MIGGSQSMLAACLTLVTLVNAVHARIIVVHSSSTQACYDRFNNRVPCPMSKTTVIVIVVVAILIVLASVGFFLFRIFRRRRVQAYQQLPTPPPGTIVTQGGVMIPAAPGEMGYAGPQPQVPYVAPHIAYNTPQKYPTYAPQPYVPPGPSPAPLPFVPTPVPPPSLQAAATHYGYSAGPI